MVAIRARRSMGSKVTGAAPKEESYIWQCWATNGDGKLLCEPGRDGLPKAIYGGTTAEAAAAAHQRHMFQVHPTPQQRSEMAFKGRRPVRTTQPRWSK